VGPLFAAPVEGQIIFLATCFGANIYNFTENIDKSIIGWSGVFDAIMVGYVIALLVKSI